MQLTSYINANVRLRSHEAVSTHIVEQRDVIRAILELSIQTQAKEKSRSRAVPENSSSKASPELVSSPSIGRQWSRPDEKLTLAPSLPSRAIVPLPMRPSILMAIPHQSLPDRETSTDIEETSNNGRLCTLASQDNEPSATQGKCIIPADCTPTLSACSGGLRTPTESTVDRDGETGKILEIFLMNPIIHDLVDVIQLSWTIHKAQMQQEDVRKQISRINQEGRPALPDLYQNLYGREYKAIDKEIGKAGSGASLVSLKRTTSNLWHHDIYFKGVPGLQFVLQRTMQYTDQSQYEQHPMYKTVKPYPSYPSLPVPEAELPKPPAPHCRKGLSPISTEAAAAGASTIALVPDSTTSQISTARARDTADRTDTQVPTQASLKRRTTFGLSKFNMNKLSLFNLGKSTSSDAVVGTGSAKRTLPDRTRTRGLPSRSRQVARPLRHNSELPQLATWGGIPVETETLVGGQRKPKPAALKLQISRSEWENASSYLISLNTAHFIRSLQDVQYPTGLMRPNSDCNYGQSASKIRYDIPFLMQFQHLITETPAKATIDLLICSTNKAAVSAQSLSKFNLSRRRLSKFNLSRRQAGTIKYSMIYEPPRMDEDHRLADEETDYEEEVKAMANSAENDESDDEEEEAVEDMMDEAEANRVVRELLGKYTTLFANQGVGLDIPET